MIITVWREMLHIKHSIMLFYIYICTVGHFGDVHWIKGILQR